MEPWGGLCSAHTDHGRIFVIVVCGLFPPQDVVVVHREPAILVLPLALLRLLFRVGSEIVLRQVIGQRHA
jgi:hypothetical protein